MNRLDSYTPLGYSLCGVVVEVGAGRRASSRSASVVACAGNEFALHAEVNWVPVNLCVPVPDGVDPRARRLRDRRAPSPCRASAAPRSQLGETACVIGLGLVGQLRRAAARRGRRAGRRRRHRRGTLPSWPRRPAPSPAPRPTTTGVGPRSSRSCSTATGGLGADHVFLAAGGDSNGPVELAARLARDRGPGRRHRQGPPRPAVERLLREGARRPLLPLLRARAATTTATSCEGIDYPVGYVRWTERRNLACFLDLLAGGSVDVEPLVSGVAPRRRGDARSTSSCAPATLHGRRLPLRVPRRRRPTPAADAAPVRRSPRPAPASRPGRRRPDRAARLHRRRQLRLVDAAAPPGERDPASSWRTVATTTSLSAVNAQRKFGFGAATTDADGRARRPDDRRRLRRRPGTTRTPASCAGRSSRQGGLRREAARAHRTRSSTGSSTTVERDRQRPADGRLQPALRPAASPTCSAASARSDAPVTRALPRQRRAARRRQLVPRRRSSRARGSSARAATSSTRLSALARPARRSRWTPTDARGSRPARHAALRRRLHRRRSPTSPAATAGSRRRPSTSRRRPQRPAGQLHRGPRSGAATARTSSVPSAGRTRASAPSWPRSSRPCAPASPMPIDAGSLVATTRATLAVEQSLLSGQRVTL